MKERKRAAMKRVAKVQAILRRWDPIGVLPGVCAPSDEYDTYAPHIVSMVAQDCSREQLCAHLEEVRTVTIGVGADRQRDWECAGEIIEALHDQSSMTLEGIQITDPAWEVGGAYSLSAVLRALPQLASEGAVLYLEGGHLTAAVVEFLSSHSLPETTTVYPGTIAPPPLRFHVPATEEVLSWLAMYSEADDVFEAEICDHLVLYQGSRVLISGYDCGSLPLILDRSLPEPRVYEFAALVGGDLNRAV